MDSALKTYHHPILTLSTPSLSKTLTPQISLKPPKPHRENLPLRCCSSSSPHSSPFPFLIKPTLITLTATAALFLSRFPNPSPSLASPIPPSVQQQQQQESLEEDEIQSLRSFMDLKIKSNQFSEAAEIIDQIIALGDPDAQELRLLKSHLLIQSGDVDSAKEILNHLISQNPFTVEAYHGLVIAHRESGEDLGPLQERIEGAMAMCRREKRKEDLRDFKLLKAEIKTVEGKYEEAIKVYEELTKEEPRDFRPYLCEGIIYTLLRREKEAERAFEKYRRLVPRGHPYAQYFDDNMIAMKVFGQMEENKRRQGLRI